MLGIFLRSFDLFGVPVEKKIPCVGPFLIEGSAKTIPFNNFSVGSWNILIPVMGGIKFV